MRFLDESLLNSRDLLRRNTGKVGLTKPLLQAQPADRSAEALILFVHSLLCTRAVILVELIQNSIRCRLVITKTNSLPVIGYAKSIEVRFRAASAHLKPTPRDGKWLEVASVKQEAGFRHLTTDEQVGSAWCFQDLAQLLRRQKLDSGLTRRHEPEMGV